MDYQELIKHIDALRSRIDELRPIDAELEQRIIQKFRLDWDYHSSSIEGNSLTYGETKTFLLHGLTAAGKPLKDHLEIKGHHKAVLELEAFVHGDKPLTEHALRGLHELILKEPYTIPAQTPDGKPTTRTIQPGRYKQQPNHVRTATGETFYFTPPEQTPAEMEKLFGWYNKERAKEDLHPLELAALLHYRFIRIHPFDDGNGRIARILMNLVLMMHGYPPVVIRTEEKEEYFRALRQADGGTVSAFVEYIGEQLVRSLELYLKGARGENIEDEDDLNKEIALFKSGLPESAAAPTLRKSKEVLYTMFEKSLLPFLERLLNKLSGFDELFSEKIIAVQYRGTNVARETAEGADDSIGLIEESNEAYPTNRSFISETRRYAKHSHSLSKIILDYQLFGYQKEGCRPFGAETRVEFDFDDYSYVINRGYSRTVVSKRYSEQLTREEETILIKEIVRSTMENIRERVEAFKEP